MWCLYGMISKEDLAAIMATEDLEETANLLMRAAMEGGGKDNISLVLLQDDTEFPEPEEKTEETGAEAPAEADEEVTEE